MYLFQVLRFQKCLYEDEFRYIVYAVCTKIELVLISITEGKSSSDPSKNKGQGFVGKNDANYFCVPFMDMERF